MVVVGLIAAVIGGRALWVVPLSFVTMMAAGGALGMAGFALPYVEIGIAISVVALGAMAVLQRKFPLAVAAVLVGLFAIFHGQMDSKNRNKKNSGHRNCR